MTSIGNVSNVDSGFSMYSDPADLYNQFEQLIELKKTSFKSPSDQLALDVILKMQILSQGASPDHFKQIQELGNHLDAFLEHLDSNYFDKAKGELDDGELKDIQTSLYKASKKMSENSQTFSFSKKMLRKRLNDFLSNGINTMSDMVVAIRIISELGSSLTPSFVRLIKEQISLFVESTAANSTNLRSLIAFMQVAKSFLTQFDSQAIQEQEVSDSAQIGFQQMGGKVTQSMASSAEVVGIDVDVNKKSSRAFKNSFFGQQGGQGNAADLSSFQTAEVGRRQNNSFGLNHKKHKRTSLSGPSVESDHGRPLRVKSVESSHPSSAYNDSSDLTDDFDQDQEEGQMGNDGQDIDAIKDLVSSFILKHQDQLWDQSSKVLKGYLEIETNRSLPNFLK